MNLKKIYPFLVAVILIFISCGGDDESLALKYIESDSGYESYTLYVGSESGGVEVHTDSIKDRIDLIFPVSVFENYTNASISFWGDAILIEQSGAPTEKSLYKFEDNSLYIYNEEVPVYYGDGDESALIIRQHYIAYKQPEDEVFNNIAASPQKVFDKDKAAAESPFGTIANMKAEGDTLIWCTRKSVFR